MEWLVPLYAFLFGAVIGSFLNVVIHRYPLEESIVFPPSRCPNCRAKIRPWDNIPIISYIVLLGRCRHCKEPISLRYPLVELANALFYTAIAIHTGLSLGLPLLAAIASMLIVLIFIDLDIQILPDVIDLPGIAIGLLIGWLHLGDRYPHLVLSSTPLDSVIGAAAGWLILFTIAFAWRLVRKIEGMGQGDMKMLAMIGAVVGWKPLLPLLFLASLSGAVIGVSLALVRREGMQFALPFGVFLGIATFTVIFFGHTLFAWYVTLLVR